MAILFNEKEGIFHLQAGDSSYVMKLYKKGYLSHVYWGKRLRSSNLSYALRTIKGVWETNHDPEDKTYSLDLLPMEYPSYGSTRPAPSGISGTSGKRLHHHRPAVCFT